MALLLAPLQHEMGSILAPPGAAAGATGGGEAAANTAEARSGAARWLPPRGRAAMGMGW